MRKMRLILTAAVVMMTLTAASPASAYWTFLTYDYSTLAICTGEDNSSVGGPYCDVSTAWGTRVQTGPFGYQCAATITCVSGLAHTCLASNNPPWGVPAICLASSADGGQHRVLCKSYTGGSWSAYCS